MAAVRSLYRDFLHLMKHLKSQMDDRRSVRQQFLQPLAANETLEDRLRQGQSRLSFARMNAIQYKPRLKRSTNDGTAESSSSSHHQRFIYKDGQRYDVNEMKATLRTDKGYTISPFDGKNLDPESVTRHKKNLRRAGFVNNAHAKGIF
jgi:hypothetical protein